MPQTNLDTTFQLVLSLAFQILMDLPSIINPRFNLNPQADQPTRPTLSASSPLNTKTVPRDTLLEGTS